MRTDWNTVITIWKHERVRDQSMMNRMSSPDRLCLGGVVTGCAKRGHKPQTLDLN